MTGLLGLPLVRWPWCGLWPLAAPVLASWCFLPRRAPLACRLPLGRRLASVGLGLGLGLPPLSRLVSGCRWWCSLAGFPGCPLGVTGCPLVLVFGRSGLCCGDYCISQLAKKILLSTNNLLLVIV